MPRSLDVLLTKICLHGTTLESTFVGLPDLAWSSRFFVTRMKFLQLFGYCTLISCTFTLCIKNVWGYFHSIMAHFELKKQMFLNLTMLLIHSCRFKIIHWVGKAQHASTPSSMRLPATQVPTAAWIALVTGWTQPKLACSKILQNLWFTQVFVYLLTCLAFN